jgi:hypothetical protein
VRASQDSLHGFVEYTRAAGHCCVSVVAMAGKVPSPKNEKKKGKTLKEKRAAKKAKKS